MRSWKIPMTPKVVIGSFVVVDIVILAFIFLAVWNPDSCQLYYKLWIQCDALMMLGSLIFIKIELELKQNRQN